MERGDKHVFGVSVAVPSLLVAKARLHLEKGHKDRPVLSFYQDTILLLYTCQCIKYYDYLFRMLGCSEDRFDFT